MGRWLDRYQGGAHVETWCVLLLLGAHTRYSDRYGDPADMEAVVRETMRRTRRNIERLVDLLPQAGWRFRQPRAVFSPPPGDISSSLDELEGEVGRLPRSLRLWLEEVGSVSLAGDHPDWGYEFVDHLEVRTSVAHIRREHAQWRESRQRGSRFPFMTSIAPDYLHKHHVGGGQPYSLAIPDDGMDGFLYNEYHQTTFVNYLRIAFSWSGLPGWDRSDPSWALHAGEPPRVLREIARELEPI